MCGTGFQGIQFRSTVLVFFPDFCRRLFDVGDNTVEPRGASQFDAGSLLLYPISLVKIFVVDFASELTSLGSIFAIPIVMAVALGSGLGRQNVVLSLIGGVFALLLVLPWRNGWRFHWSINQEKTHQGETMLAAIGALLGIGGAFAGQLAPMLLEHEGLWQALHWSPVGVAVMAVVGAPHGVSIGDYLTALAFLSGYTLVLIAIAFWIAGALHSRWRESIGS